MNKTGLGALCIGALCSLMIGCGGGSVDINNLGDAYVNALCDHYQSCGVVSSHDTCVAILKQQFNFDTFVATVNAGKATYDGSAAKACFDAIGSLSCDPSAEDNRVSIQDCVDLGKGTVADGGACQNNVECKSQSCNTSSGTGTCPAGTCDPTPPANAAIGATCGTSGNTFINCVDGAYCDATNKCVALLAENATCQADNQCGYGLVCATTGTKCVKPPQKAGDACVAHNAATTPDCVVEGLACGANNQCVTLGDTGATCNNTTEPCMGDLACSSTCGPLPAIGASCPGFQCAPGAYCQFDQTTGQPTTCAALKANGTTCANSFECDSQNCDSTSMQCTDLQACI